MLRILKPSHNTARDPPRDATQPAAQRIVLKQNV